MTALVHKVLLALALLWLPAAHAALDPQAVKGLAGDDSDAKIAAINLLAASGDEAAARVLNALAADTLYKAGDSLIVMDGDTAIDAATGAALPAAPENRQGIGINNRIRGVLNGALAGIKLLSADREVRLAAAKELESGAEPEQLPLIVKALQNETDPGIRKRLAQAQAQAGLKSPDPAMRRAAVQTLGESSSPATRTLLAGLLEKRGNDYAEPDEGVRLEARAALKAVESRLAFADNVGKVFSGLSLGSILLLAALGLAITYGVMGVINMAHGELLMIGAYSSFMMQSLFRAWFPGAEDWYLVAAIPVAFTCAALVGVLMERTVIRFLYGRPLETLLATWGLSLMLIQASRMIFGAQNVEVANPSWMSGGIEVMSGVVLPLNRIVIIGFSLAVLLLVWLLMNKTRLGMFVRAVTQNRAMASCVGVPTGRIDTLAFAIGAGIAGLGGMALSQISNVGPDMGQGYIVDSFMVVVLGGVGQLAGAVWAALGLGVVTKFLEGWTGAVIAKIVVLVFIIVFIQKRPQGIFALKGRFVEN
jgi:urea transport system permease protein